MDVMQFIPEQLMILVAALYVIGMVLKATSGIPDWTIPWLLLICGMVGSVALLGATPTAIIQGILCAGACVFANQLIKQATKK